MSALNSVPPDPSLKLTHMTTSCRRLSLTPVLKSDPVSNESLSLDRSPSCDPPLPRASPSLPGLISSSPNASQCGGVHGRLGNDVSVLGRDCLPYSATQSAPVFPFSPRWEGTHRINSHLYNSTHPCDTNCGIFFTVASLCEPHWASFSAGVSFSATCPHADIKGEKLTAKCPSADIEGGTLSAVLAYCLGHLRRRRLGGA